MVELVTERANKNYHNTMKNEKTKSWKHFKSEDIQNECPPSNLVNASVFIGETTCRSEDNVGGETF